MNNTVKWIIITVLVMLVLPWVILAGAQAEAMGLIFILLYAVYPVYSVLIGWQAGKEIKKNWFLPILSPCLFLLCVVVFFTLDEGLFYVFALIYLVIGLLAMAFSGGRNKGNLEEDMDKGPL